MTRFIIHIVSFLFYLIPILSMAEAHQRIIVDANRDKKMGLEDAVYALEVLSGNPSGCDDEESEPNNTLVKATSIALDKPTTGMIGDALDADYFTFATVESGLITVTLDPVPSDTRLYAFLYDFDQTAIAAAYASETGGKVSIKKLSRAGVHYVRVFAYLSSAESYTLEVSMDRSDSYEINNSLASSATIALDTEIIGKIEDDSDDGDMDYFKFTTPTPGVIEVSVIPPSDLKVCADLYDSSQDVIKGSCASEAGAPLSFKKVSDAGTSYLKLYGSSAVESSDGPYTLKVGLDVSDPYELNNSFANASLISLNSNISGKIQDEEDKDYYKFTIEDSSEVAISVTSASDLYMEAYLYDEKANLITYSRSGQQMGKNLFLSSEIDGGTYYLKVGSGYSRKSQKFYTLSITR